MTVEYVLPLADSRAMLVLAGGKGASLARLASAGLPVPDGFHVTTAAYRQFVADNSLQPQILAALEQADVSRPTTLKTASQIIRDLFAGPQMPPAISGAIAQAYMALPGQDPAVAMRSSATAEDLPDLPLPGSRKRILTSRE